MEIIIDTREQNPWTFEGEVGVETTRAKLDAGDYSLAGYESRVAIERKSMEDFANTVLRDRSRFYRELELLRAFDFRCVIVESGVREICLGQYRSKASPKSLLGFIGEIAVAQRVPVYLAGSRPEAQVLAATYLRAVRKTLISDPSPTD